MTNISKNNYLESALKAGLSAKASTVYVTLLEAHSPLSPKALVIRSKLHRQYVYDALEKLLTRNLIIKKGERKQITYTAGSPDTLLQEAEKRRLDALDGVTSLMRLYDKSPAGVVEIIRGSQAVIEDEFRMLQNSEQNSTLEIIGGAGMHWVELFGDEIKAWEKIRKDKKIKFRYIGSGEDVHYNREKSIINHESRLIPGIGNIVNVVIRPNSVSFNIYEPEIMIVRVKSPESVTSQRALFEILWNLAK